MVGGSLTRVRNNQVYNSDIYASAKLVAKSVTGGLLSDNFTYAGSMTIGNLTVNGNTTTLDTTNLVVADPLLAINRNQSGAPSYDLGFVMGRGSSTNVAMIWEETNKQFQLQYTSESTASTTYGTINNSGFANLQAYGILLNNATVGTLTVTSSSQAPSYTTTNGGQFTGYFTGAIGANTANSGAFTTLSTTGNATIQGNILVTGNIIPSTSNIYSLGSSANRFANLWIKGTAIYLGSIAVSDGGGYLQVTDPNTGLQLGIQTASINNTVIGNTGPAAATFTTATVNGTLYAATVNAGTIGNSGATFSGTSINLTGNASVNAISAYQVGNTNTILEGTIGSATPSQPNITSVGTLTSLTTSGSVTASGNITAQTANIYAANIIGNTSLYGAQYYWTNGATLASTITGTYSNSNVTAYLPTYSGTLSPSSLTTNNGGQISGYLTGAIGANAANSAVFTTVSATNNITATTANIYAANVIGNTAAYGAQYYWTNGATLASTITGTYSNSNVGGYLTSYSGALTASSVTTTGGGQLTGYLTGAIGANSANSAVFTTVSASGNITAQTANVYAANFVANTASYSPVYYYPNGVNILSAVTSSAYSNANAAAYLTTYTGNLLAGNITALNNITGYLNGVIGANAANSATFTTTSITSATNTSGLGTGALVVTQGGAAIQQDLYVGGNIYAGNIISQTSQQLVVSDPLIYLSANAGSYNYEIGFFSHFVGGNVPQYAHTGLVRNHTDQNWYLFSNLPEPSGGTVNLSNASIVYDTIRLGAALIQNTTTASSTTSGALQVAGGAGIAGALYAGSIQNTPIGSVTPSSGVFTGVTSTGQVTGYLTGAIGANTANSGTFTTLTASTVSTSGNITAQTANVYAANLIGNTALYSAQFYWTNGATLASTITGSFSNSNVNSYLPTYTGTLSPSSLTTNNGGQVIAYLTGAIGANNANTGTFTTLTASGTITGAGQVVGYFNGAIGANTANSGTFTTVVASGNITAQTANVYAANIIGNTALYGAQFYWSNGAALANTITGLYGNSNVATYLPTYTGTLSPSSVTTNSGGQLTGYHTGAIGANVANTGAFTSLTTSSTIVSQGTITGAGQVVGYFNGVIGANNANSGTFTTVVASGNITAQTANVYAANLIGNTALYGAQYYWSNGATLAATITGTYGNSNVAVYLPTYTGNISAGNVNLSGALTSPNIFANSGTNSTSTTSGALQVQGGVGITGNIYLGSNVFAGSPSYSDVNIKYSGSMNINNYVQSILQNTNNGTAASADFIVNNDQSTATTYYGDFGINSSGFSGTGSLAAPNNVYLTSTSSDLVLGTTTSNAIRFVVNNGATDSLIVNTNGNVTIPTTTTSTSSTTGALVVGGGIGVTGNLNVSANSYYGTATNVPSTYVSNIYPYANSGNVNVYTVGNSNLTVNANQLVANLVVHGNSAAGYQNLLVTNGATGQVGIKIAPNAITTGASFVINSTDSMLIPVGTTAQRPSGGSVTAGMIRFNNLTNQLEFYSGTSWQSTGSTFTVVTSDQFTGDGSTVNFTLSQSTSTTGTIVAINGVIQIPTTAYSVSGTTLTFTEAPLSTDIIDARSIVTTAQVTAITDATGANAFIANSFGAVTTASNVIRHVANSSNYFSGGIAAAMNPISLTQNTPTAIDTFTAATHRGAKYVIKVSDATSGNYSMAEVIVVHNGTTPTSQVYGVVNTGSNSLATFSTTLSAGSVNLLANTWSSTATATVFPQYMPV